MTKHDLDRTDIKHANKFTMVNTRNFEPGSQPYVLPRQCDQVFYSEVPGRVGWSYVVIYDPRGRPIKYNLLEQEHIEEEYDVEEQLVHALDEDVE